MNGPDTDRLDFLTSCITEVGYTGFTARRESEYSPRPGKVGVFTVPSQWVYGDDLRAAIDAAMAAAGKET